MKHKRILTIIIIMLLAFVIVGSVQAETNGSKTTIRGVDFNIPDGFEKSDASTENEFDPSTNSTTDIIVFTNDGKAMSITVMEFNETVPDDMLKDSGNSTTIKDVNGSLKEDDGGYTFSFIDGKCFVMVHAPDKEVIESFIV